VQHNGVVVQHNGVVGWAESSRPTTREVVGLEDSAHPTVTATVPALQVNAAHRTEPWWVRWSLTFAAIAVLTVLVIVPVVNVFYQALGRGVGVYWQNLVGDPNTRHAILLTLTVAPLAVLANLIFGVACAWAIARSRFPGRALLLTIIDLPFSVSPVVAGLMFVLLFGLQGYFGPWLRDHGIKIIFATPGLILVTAFVTLPFVVRELIPVMEAVGPKEDVAAVSLP
jgi:sulfate transport system permease protein